MAEPEPKQGEPDGGTPTITTVARLANVSIASASRALNGIRTSPETLARVPRPPRRSATCPTRPRARSARGGPARSCSRCRTSATRSTRRWSRSIQEATRESGWRLMLHSTGADTEDELAIVRDLRHRFADGLILATLEVTEAHVDELRTRRDAGRRDRPPGQRARRRRRPRPLAQGRRRGGAPPPRGRPPAYRARERARSTPFPARSGGSATSTGCASCGLRARRRAWSRSPPTSRSSRAARRPCGSSPRPARRDPLHERPARGRARSPRCTTRASTCRATSRSSGWTTRRSPSSCGRR